MRDLADILCEWERRQDEALALATLVRATGSSYRRPGARMLVSADGTTVGSLSAGCLEEEVAARALRVIRDREPTLMSFDTRFHGTTSLGRSQLLQHVPLHRLICSGSSGRDRRQPSSTT